MTQTTPTQSATAGANKHPPKNRHSKFAPNAAPMNPDKVSEMNMDTEGAPPIISNDLIAARAYEIWEEAGREEGNDIRNWLQAEMELRNRSTDKNLIE